MYSDDDLNLAVDQGVFSQESVKAFRDLMASSRQTQAADEENFRLIGSFNDLFVVIACGLLLFSSGWFLGQLSISLGAAAFVVVSWILSEYFIRKRKMALPAIVLLVAFVGGSFGLTLSLFADPGKVAAMFAFAVAAMAAYGHWRRFRVPITVAAGVAATVGLMVTLMVNLVSEAWLDEMIFAGGLFAFACAMYWDTSDIERLTFRADVAFWLHLLSAPLLIHPVFTGLGVLQGADNLQNMIIVIALYLALTLISIVIDRRALMVSSLVYVVYALASLFNQLGNIGEGLALTGILMGSALLVLSVYWHHVRASILSCLPNMITEFLPFGVSQKGN